jgi:glucose-1-phosphate adenylyltransferase
VDSIIMEDCVLEDNVIVNKSILLTGVTVKANNVVGNGADIAVIDEGRVLSGSGYLN